jgi:diaminopimelate decarboxylase
MNPKLSLFPLGTDTDLVGQLTFRGHNAVELARQFGTPLYIYDIDTIRHNINIYRQSLGAYSGATSLTYASKAFLCAALARLMAEEDVGLDVSSAGEIFVARSGGGEPAKMHLHGNNKSRLDLEYALDAGVGQIVVDNQAELALLAHLAQEYGKSVKVWLRVTPGIAVETHHRYTVTGTADSKFGIPSDQLDGVAAQIVDSPQLRLTGLHMHLGSHFYNAKPVAAAIERLLDVAVSLREKYGIEVTDLCPGGGWGVPYHPSDPPMHIEPFVTDVVTALQDNCQRRGLPLPHLILEPGRSLVAQAGVALYSVGSRKVIPNVRTYVGIDGGLADNPRPALYQARYTAVLANRTTEAATETVSIAGPFCESGDILIDEVDLPPATPGDVLAVPVAGAYQLSMGSNYNGARRPAVLFVDGDNVRLVQRRETFEDLLRLDTGQ